MILQVQVRTNHVGLTSPRYCHLIVMTGAKLLPLTPPCDIFFLFQGMLCGTQTVKKKKKKMMYLTSKNAGACHRQFCLKLAGVNW